MLIELNKYKTKGFFSYKSSESLLLKCNAPTDKSGVYLIYKVIGNEETLIYIGSSGQKSKDGTIKTRKSNLGGMKDRLVNGYHPKFGRIRRQKTFPVEMLKENIEELKIYWWVTFDDSYSDFPTDVESKLLKIYLGKFGKNPGWHK